MSTMRLHDSFFDHPKILRLSAEAFRVWVAAIGYANHHQTNGFIPDDVVPRFGGGTVPQSVIDELRAVRPPYAALWERDDDAKGYRIHDFLDWNAPAQGRAARAKEGRR
jgi:hypothetical protein